MPSGRTDVRGLHAQKCLNISMRWHLAREGKSYGPYDLSVLVEAVRKTILGKSDLVWRSGWDSWQPAHSVPGLFAPPDLGTLESLFPGSMQAAPTGVSNGGAPDDGKIERRKQKIANPNYFVRHWRGELSLPVSYWINGFLVFLAISIATILFGALMGEKPQAGLLVVLWLTCFLMVGLTLCAWQFVGVWRSASQHAVKGKAFWAGVAKVMVIIGIAKSGNDFRTTFFPIISEHIKIAMGDQEMGENRFRLLRNGTELEFSGGIKSGTAKEFGRMLDAASQVRVLHLNSRGGRITEADLMATEVRKRRLVTYVSEKCESACTHIFLAGHERWLGETGKLGFHQPDFAGLDTKIVADLMEEERRKLKSLGLPDDFVSKALATPTDKMWRPTNQELLAARLISGISDGSRFAVSGNVAAWSAAEIEQALLKNEFFALLKRAEPQTFDELKALIAEGYHQGASEQEIVSAGRVIVAKLVRRQLPYASDANVLQALDIRIAYMDEGCLAADRVCAA